jgi:hypothetical protein
LKNMIEELVLKLVKFGHKQLSVNVLYKMGTSAEVMSLHPRLRHTAWECLDLLSEAAEGE